MFLPFYCDDFCRHNVLREEHLCLYEVWSSRVFKGLDDSCPLSDMKETDEYAVAEMELPLVDADAVARGQAGKGVSRPGAVIHAVPAAGEGTSSPSGGTVSPTVGSAVNGESLFFVNRRWERFMGMMTVKVVMEIVTDMKNTEVMTAKVVK